MSIAKRSIASDAKRTDKRVRFGTKDQASYFCYGVGDTRTVFFGLVKGKYQEFVRYNYNDIPLNDFIATRAAYRIERKNGAGNWVG